MSDESYLHGYDEGEAARLEAQAEFLAPWVFDGLDLRGAGRVLEIGVGVGAETRIVRRLWPELEVIGVDVARGSLARARRSLAVDVQSGRVELLRASGERLPLADGSVDVALFIWVLEHARDPGRVMAEAARCLRAGGRLIAVEVYNRSLLIEPRRRVLEEYWEALNDVQTQAGGHPHAAAHLPAWAAGAGLEVERLAFRPIVGDRRDPTQRTAILRYFEGLFRSAEPRIVAQGRFPAARVPEVWRAFDEVVATPDALFVYTSGLLTAVKRVRSE